jgi:SAM-dependent methyltransferase
LQGEARLSFSLRSRRPWRHASSFIGGIGRKISMTREEQVRIDKIYKNTPFEEIPWNIEAPPELLVELVDSGKVQPCKVIDLGCGAGNCAIYLAGRGFEVTGVDFSPAAIKIARENADRKGVKCSFFVADVIEGLDKINQTWDFAYDWGLLHHIFPEQRQKYVENVCRILNLKSKYLSVSFSGKDTGFGGSGKYRKTSLGTILYFSSEAELRVLFEPYFHVIDLRTVEVDGKFGSHIFDYVFMERE